MCVNRRRWNYEIFLADERWKRWRSHCLHWFWFACTCSMVHLVNFNPPLLKPKPRMCCQCAFTEVHSAFLTSQHVPAAPLDIFSETWDPGNVSGTAALWSPRGINSSPGIGCKHNGIRHPARGGCRTVPPRCDTHAYCHQHVYWIKSRCTTLFPLMAWKVEHRNLKKL